MADTRAEVRVAAPLLPQSAASWPASRLIHRTIVHARLATQVGAVVDVVFSPETRQLVGLLMGTSVAESRLLELARRLVGSDLWLTFVPIERVLALYADVVMIETEAGAGIELARPLPPLAIRHMPRLQSSMGFEVLTMQGQRLGRLVDLLLDAEGRRIKGYVVSRPAAPSAGSWAGSGARPELGPQAVAPSATPGQQVPAPAPPADQFMIPARFRVRFGRGLVVVGEDVSRPVVPSVPAGQRAEWPAPAWADEPRKPAEPAGNTPTDPPASPDAPTEELAPPV